MLNARYRLIDQTGDLMHYRSTKSPMFNVTRLVNIHHTSLFDTDIDLEDIQQNHRQTLNVVFPDQCIIS